MKPLRTALIGGPALLLAATVTPLVLFWGDLPSPVAIHWGFSGRPDGSAAPLLLGLGMVAVFVAIWWAVGWAAKRTPIESPSYLAGLWFFGGLLAAVSWLTVLANRDIADWSAADEVTLLHLLIVIAVAIVMGFAGWLAAGGRSTVATPVPSDSPTPIPTGTVWSGRGRGWVTTVAGIGIIVAGLVMWGWISVGLAVVGLILLVFAEVRLTVGPGGAVVSMGWIGFPSRRIPLETIRAATAEQVSPLSYGGWGYRGRPGVRAILVRGGEGVRIHRDGKPDLVVTVDDAERGAQVLDAMVRRG